jgi:hypothetical protein
MAGAAMVSGLAAGVTPADAHHSFAMYDSDKTVTVEGTVSDFRWANPHVLVIVSGKSAPSETADQSWTLELPAPGQMVRIGWTHSSLDEGEKVKVTLHPFKDGRPGGSLLTVTTPDGKTLANRGGPT